jgi:iron only hydrogenase large subunit-like protein
VICLPYQLMVDTFSLVFDTTFPRALSLLESRAELHERRSHFYASPTPNLPSILSASTSGLAAPTKLDPASSSIAPLPVLSSACPGWICYAEKTHGDLLPFVSGVKSPQAVAGVLVKGNVVAGRLGLR